MANPPIRPLLAIFLLTASLHAEDESPAPAPAADSQSKILGAISDGKPGLPAPKPEPIKFKVLGSITKRVHVVESPEMPGLPAPEGKINVTVQLVKDPGLPDPPPPLPALPPDDPAVLARMAELTEHYRETELVFVSATVFDHSRTLLRCYPSGGGDRKEISAWSNLDFNHFSGFGTYQVKGSDGVVREYGLLMGIGNEVTLHMPELLEKDHRAHAALEIPALPDLAVSGPAFVVTEGDTSDREAMELIEGLHLLYRAEGKRMEEAYHARVKAYEDRKSYLLANPPVPEDVVIRLWKRDLPSNSKAGCLKPAQGGSR